MARPVGRIRTRSFSAWRPLTTVMTRGCLSVGRQSMIHTRFLYRCLLMACLVVFSLSVRQTPAQETWRVGAARVNITPDQPLWMAGYASRTHEALGKYCDLWIRTCALEDSAGAARCARVTGSGGHGSRIIASHLSISGATLRTAPEPGGVVFYPHTLRARGGKESRAAALPATQRRAAKTH